MRVALKTVFTFVGRGTVFFLSLVIVQPRGGQAPALR